MTIYGRFFMLVNFLSIASSHFCGVLFFISIVKGSSIFIPNYFACSIISSTNAFISSQSLSLYIIIQLVKTAGATTFYVKLNTSFFGVIMLLFPPSLIVGFFKTKPSILLVSYTLRPYFPPTLLISFINFSFSFHLYYGSNLVYLAQAFMKKGLVLRLSGIPVILTSSGTKYNFLIAFE